MRVFVSGPWKTQIGVAEFALLATAVIIAATLAFWLTPETVRLQGLAFSAEGAAKHPAYDEFFTYHRVARALYVINLGFGITLLCMKVRKWVR